MTPGDRAFALFEKAFRLPPTHIGLAPGRVNIIGDHTDHAGGLAMPTAIQLCTAVAIAPAGGYVSRAVTEHAPGSCVEWRGASAEGWAALIAEVVARTVFDARCDGSPALLFAVASDLPVGCGLSSSAALATAICSACESLLDIDTPRNERAICCQRAEHAATGVRCGLLDQLAIVHGSANGPLLIDFGANTIRPLGAGSRRAHVAVFDSGDRRSLAAGGYARLQKASADACRAFACCPHLPPLGRLRNLATLAGVDFRSQQAADAAHHVITECARVEDAAEAWERGDASAVGAAMNVSHESSRDRLCSTTRHIDALVGRLQRHPSVHGARMTGGGFGGAVAALVEVGSDMRELLRYAQATAPAARLILSRVRPTPAASSRRVSG